MALGVVEIHGGSPERGMEHLSGVLFHFGAAAARRRQQNAPKHEGRPFRGGAIWNRIAHFVPRAVSENATSQNPSINAAALSMNVLCNDACGAWCRDPMGIAHCLCLDPFRNSA